MTEQKKEQNEPASKEQLMHFFEDNFIRNNRKLLESAVEEIAKSKKIPAAAYEPDEIIHKAVFSMVYTFMRGRLMNKDETIADIVRRNMELVLDSKKEFVKVPLRVVK